MRKFILSFALLALVVFLQSSCKINVLRGEGPKTTANVTVTPFDAVDVDVTLKAVIQVQDGAQPGIVFNGYENILKHIKTKVVNNKLTIYTDLDETWTMDSRDLIATITTPSLAALSMSGAPDADIQGNLTGKEFKIDISGASTIKIDNLNVDDFTVDISGVGNLTVKGGSVKHAEYEISGAGSLKAFQLQTLETIASVSGTGSTEVSASQKLTADISGASSLKYKGHPSISQDVSGVSSIKDAN